MNTIDTAIRATADRPGPIGVFDSGYGGLTILRRLRAAMPEADFIYLGDNARAPYGSRSFDLVYRFTLEAVRYLFARGCPLVILACNTASAKALRTIQQTDLPDIAGYRRVLGVIRPTAESVDGATASRHVGLFGTPGTVASQSYDMELGKLAPDITLSSYACPMWVPLVENREYDSPGADYFVKKDIDALFAADSEIDTLILGCTHYPLLIDKIRQYVPSGVRLLDQGKIVADSLADYLLRHPEMDRLVTRGGTTEYLTTEDARKFSDMASVFMASPAEAARISDLTKL
ncbi:MAG: glutamate racemase [Muribaculaceae bacterium]|nr:glutamate racemase [Muribaculaceae bacterium]